MFGAFKPSQPLLGGLLWKIPWRMSAPQKYRHRQRMRRVDRIVDCVDNALKKQGVTIEAVERWKAEMPTEAEMEPKDKYTIFARNERGYRKGLHKVPKWTRVSQRVNPPGF
ncbi:mitochondrial ribosomal protein L31-domain-containing protein [Tricharina praecox]|uniref:mitochondrial ribosomal protein L31-domain-containing protein n=1 Tax=Tricharina praecox TaxID=43433 RepID=UPI002220A557|nr:mitochondrial ribosomal protein L31-domain-containing protein [Tricharina praecox]KAI5848326.1 mitochondrial ribosomal protein L31-domain-containing protein [Tricharina praecox]